MPEEIDVNEGTDEISRDLSIMEEKDEKEVDDKAEVKAEELDDELIKAHQEEKEREGDDEKKVEEPEKVEEKEEDKKPEDKIDKIIKARPSLSQVTQKYPELFKDFPEIKEALYRESELTRVFPTVGEAVEALERSESYEQIENDLSSGNMENLLNTVADISKDSFGKLAESFLPIVAKKDKNLYVELTSPILDRFLKALYKYGVDRNDENIQHAAEHASIFAFNDEDYATGKKEIPFFKKEVKTPREVELEKREAEFLDSRHKDSLDRVDSNIKRVILAKIEDNLDPQKALSDFARSKVVEETLKIIDDTLVNDERHMKLVKSLWGRARKANYSPEMVKRITTAYLSRAISLVPATRSKVLTKALGSTKPQESPKSAVKVIPTKGNSSQQVVSHVTDPGTIDRRKTSDLDILEGRITLKR